MLGKEARSNCLLVKQVDIWNRYNMDNFKKLLIVSALLAVSAGVSAGKNDLPNGKPFVILNQEIVEVENSVQALEDKYNSIVERITNEITGLSGQIDALNQEIGGLKTTDAELQTQINDMVEDLEAQGVTIASLVNEYNSLSEELDLLKASALDDSDLADIQIQLNNLFASIADLSPAVAELLQEVIDINALIAMLVDESGNLLALNEITVPEGECPAGQAVSAIDSEGVISCVSIASSASAEYYRKYVPTAVKDGELKTLELSCDSGQTIISGGYLLKDERKNLTVIGSYPKEGAWQFAVEHNGSGNKDGSFDAWILCTR